MTSDLTLLAQRVKTPTHHSGLNKQPPLGFVPGEDSTYPIYVFACSISLTLKT